MVKTFINASHFHKFIYKKMVINSDITYFQTKYILNFFKDFVIKDNLKWLPTHRPIMFNNRLNKSKRFKGRVLNIIFVGRIEYNKGITVLIEACSELKDVKLKIYGPIIDKSFFNAKDLPANVRYCGVVSAKQVQNYLFQSDLMVLLTTHPGEGYSGVVVESILTNTPMMLSDIKPFREMLRDDEAFFVSLNNKNEILKCLVRLSTKRVNLVKVSNKMINLHKNYDIENIGYSFHRNHVSCVE